MTRLLGLPRHAVPLDQTPAPARVSRGVVDPCHHVQLIEAGLLAQGLGVGRPTSRADKAATDSAGRRLPAHHHRPYPRLNNDFGLS